MAPVTLHLPSGPRTVPVALFFAMDPPSPAGNSWASKRQLEFASGHYWSLLWFPAGGLLGIGLTASALCTMAFQTPFASSAWLYCAVPCSTIWVLLEVSRASLNHYYFVLRPHAEDAQLSELGAMQRRSSHEVVAEPRQHSLLGAQPPQGDAGPQAGSPSELPLSGIPVPSTAAEDLAAGPASCVQRLTAL